MSNEPKDFDEATKSILPDVYSTVDKVLNNGAERPKIGLMMIFVPLDREPPVNSMILSNLTIESQRLVLMESSARLEGRVTDKGGSA